MRNLYEKFVKKCLSFCSKKKSRVVLYVTSFIESIFFPIPTDVFLIPFILSNKKSFNRLVILTTIFSVLGGLVAYIIGLWFWNNLSPTFYEYYPSYVDKINHFNVQFESLGLLLIVIGGFSPFPYKITCLGSGIIGVNVFLFLIFSFLSRALRFYIVAYLFHKYGNLAKDLVAKYINVITLIIITLGIIFFLII